MVAFLGLELMIEALWESANTHLWNEYLVVVGTLVACTFLGFAEGFGIGIALAILLFVFFCAKDTVSKNHKDPSSSKPGKLSVSIGHSDHQYS